MKVKDIMVTDVSIISVHAPLEDAVRQLKKNVGDERFINAAPGLVVLNDHGELAGIISPLSVLKAFTDTAATTPPTGPMDDSYYATLCSSLKGKLVRDVMDWQPISVTEEAELLDVASLFVQHRFQRVPVVRNKTVVGVIYRSSLMFAMASCLP